MELSLSTFPECGLPVRLADGGLAIIVAVLTPGRVLIVAVDGLHEVADESIRERPAICARCKQSSFWWQKDFWPLCLCGAHPDSEWREEVFSMAASFIRKAEAQRPDVRLTPVLGQALATGGWQYWRQLQRFAFVEAVPTLLVAWNKQQQESQG